MKPNQEITAKFYIAMIVFFAIWLSFPVKNYLIKSHIINYSNVSGFYFICLVITLVLYMVLALRYSEVKSSLKKLKEKAKNEKFYRLVSAQTITDYDNQIKCQESKITELKQAFEDAVAEITELRNKLRLSEDELRIAYERIEVITNTRNDLSRFNQELIQDVDKFKTQVTYWKERALHQKHTKKVVESDMWQCLTFEFEPNFIYGNKYKIGTKINSNNLISFFDEKGKECIVNKKNFKPVKQ